MRVGKAVVAALGTLAAAVTAADVGVEDRGRGFALSFQGRQAIAGIANGLLDVEDDAFDGLGEGATIGMWARTAPGSGWSPVFMNFATPLENDLLEFQPGGVWATRNGDLWFYAWFPANDERWYHFAVVVDGDLLTSYVNGVRGPTIEVPGYTLQQEALTLYFGGKAYTGAPINQAVTTSRLSPFSGELDDFQLWTRALTDAEVYDMAYAHVNRSSAPPEDLAIYYDFDEQQCGESTELGGQLCASSTSACRIPNRGVAGADYDLLIGQLDDTFGLGSEYIDRNDALGTRRRFDKPFLMRSTAPAPEAYNASRFWHAPRVHQIGAGANATIVLPAGATHVEAAPRTGTLVGLSGNTSIGTVTTGDSLVGLDVVKFLAPKSFNEQAVFVLGGADGGRQEVRVLPFEAPRFSSFVRNDLVPVDGKMEAGGVVQIDAPFGTTRIPLSDYAIGGINEYPSVDFLAMPEIGEFSLTPFGQWNQVPLDPAQRIHSGDELRFTRPDGVTQELGMVVRFVSPASGLQSKPLLIRLTIAQADSAPGALRPEPTVLAEDAAVASLPSILLQATDDSGEPPMLVIKTLPKHGYLMAENPDGTKFRITEPFNENIIGDVYEQFASEVLNVSSHNGEILSLLGPSPCLRYSGVTCTTTAFREGYRVAGSTKGNTTATADSPSQLVLYKFVGIITEISDTQPETFTVRAPFLYHPDRNEDGSAAQCVVADIDGDSRTATYLEGDCSVEAATKLGGNQGEDARIVTGLRDYNDFKLDKSENRIVPYTIPFQFHNFQLVHGSWQMSAEAYKANPRFDFNGRSHEQWYRDEGFTEFIEVAFARAVFPIAVQVGLRTGGGSIVGVKVRGPDDAWHRMYQAPAQRSEAALTDGFFHFDPRMCRKAFKTNAVRIEYDLSSATGIPSRTETDFVGLIGSDSAQPGMLRHGKPRVWYVPEPEFSGNDTFTFTALDCDGRRLRAAEEVQTAKIMVTAVPDAPELCVRSVLEIDGAGGMQPAPRLLLGGVLCDGGGEGEGEGVGDGGGDNSTTTDGNANSVHVRVWCGGEKTGKLRLPLQASDADAENTTVALAMTTDDTALLQARYEPPGADVFSGALVVEADCLQVFRTFFEEDNVENKQEYEVTLRVSDTSGMDSSLVVTIELFAEDREAVGKGTRTLVLALTFVNLTLCGIVMGWVVVNRKGPIVKAAQLPFILIMLLGGIVSTCTIPLLVIDDVVFDQATADLACMASTWTYCIGFVLTIAPLAAKLQRASILFSLNDAMAKGFSKRISTKTVMMQVVKTLLVDLVLLVVGSTVGDGTKFKRRTRATTEDGYPLSSYGMCSVDVPMLPWIVLVYHTVVLCTLGVISLKTMHINTAFSEGKYLRIAVIGMIQLMLISIPINLIAVDSTSTIAFMRAGMLFLNDISALLLVFVPKMVATHFPDMMTDLTSGTGAEFIAGKVGSRKQGNSSVIAPVSSGAGSVKGSSVKGSSVKGKQVSMHSSSSKSGAPASGAGEAYKA